MKMSECIQYLNQALNYPGLSFQDISIYFDMAIAELNTTLHTSIPIISKILSTYRNETIKNMTNLVQVKSTDVENGIPQISASTDQSFYYDTTNNVFKVKTATGSYLSFDTIIGRGYFNGEEEYFQPYKMGSDLAWVKSDIDPNDADLEEYFPTEWILLWLIPYVCYKYTCRDGGTASVFADEINQGYQQLQETYDVPSTVILTTYADRLAYRELVQKAIEQGLTLNVKVPTKAIYEDMKHSRNTQAVYGSIFDAGGFGI